MQGAKRCCGSSYIHSLKASHKLDGAGADVRRWYVEGRCHGAGDLRLHPLLMGELVDVSDDVEYSIWLGQFQCVFRHSLVLIRAWTEPTGNNRGSFLGTFREHARTVIHNIRDIANFLENKENKLMLDGIV